MADYDSPFDQRMNDAMARSFFVSAWIEAEEEAGRSHSGENIMESAPPTPDEYRLIAAKATGKIEQANGMPFCALYSQACRADYGNEDAYLLSLKACAGEEMPEELRKSHLEHLDHFGFFFAQMCLGSGASWFDSHEKFDVFDGINRRKLVTPSIECHIDRESLDLINFKAEHGGRPPLSAPQVSRSIDHFR